MSIIENKIMCLRCNTIVESKTVHDFKWCKCGKVAVDGGKDYLKRMGDPKNIKELSHWEDT